MCDTKGEYCFSSQNPTSNKTFVYISAVKCYIWVLKANQWSALSKMSTQEAIYHPVEKTSAPLTRGKPNILIKARCLGC